MKRSQSCHEADTVADADPEGIIGRMSDRATADAGPMACPFVAFEDDRGRRAVVPDRRHRCFAELRPAPRAVAHQETYCLSAGFAACPTFQDWARRQAAREVAADARDVEVVGEMAGEAPASTESPSYDEPRPPRRPRDWTAPPPWMADGPASHAGEQLGAFDALDEPPAAWPDQGTGSASRTGGDPELAALLRPGGEIDVEDDEGELPAFLAGRRRPASRPSSRPPTGRAVNQAHPAGPSLRRPVRDPDAPPWERPRRFEAYPTLRSRASIPRLPGIALAMVALGGAALLVFLLPSLLSAPTTTPPPSPTATATATSGLPTDVPSPTAQVYVVVSGDTIIKIANKFGLTPEALLAANPQIKNPNRIAVGDQVTIPAPATPAPGPTEGASANP